jgi:hypothetical protein
MFAWAKRRDAQRSPFIEHLNMLNEREIGYESHGLIQRRREFFVSDGLNSLTLFPRYPKASTFSVAGSSRVGLEPQ